MVPLHCRRVDLARAGLPPGAPLDPASAAHVRECARCRDAIRTDALVSESLVRRAEGPQGATLSEAARARLDTSVHRALQAERRAERADSWHPYLAAAAVVLLSVALGTQVAGVVSAPQAAAKAPVGTTEGPPLLEALVARHIAAGEDPAAAPLPSGVLFASRLPSPLAIGVAPVSAARSASLAQVPRPSFSAACPLSGEEGDSTLFVLDRSKVGVDADLASALDRDGAVSVVLQSARVMVAARDARLFVTVTTLAPRPEFAGRIP